MAWVNLSVRYGLRRAFVKIPERDAMFIQKLQSNAKKAPEFLDTASAIFEGMILFARPDLAMLIIDAIDYSPMECAWSVYFSHKSLDEVKHGYCCPEIKMDFKGLADKVIGLYLES